MLRGNWSESSSFSPSSSVEAFVALTLPFEIVLSVGCFFKGSSSESGRGGVLSCCLNCLRYSFVTVITFELEEEVEPVEEEELNGLEEG